MSSIDDRVVRMEFDNKQFESGVQTTMTTLEKLNNVLKFRNGADGFNDIQRASSNINFSALSDNLLQVQQNFSFFGEFVRTIFDRISNKIIDTGTAMANMLVLDPLRSGFGEYQLSMNSVRTIMSGTGKDLETVTSALNQLNEYADQTIYSFSDMTTNIGKFTNAGIDLDLAVDAIKGISNAAADAGAGSAQASSAMYNLAQSMSQGYLTLIDWRSVSNIAGMGTEDFRQNLIETAVAMGTLRKEGDKYISTTTDMNGKVSEAFDAFKGFDNSLSHQWASEEVLVEALGHYAQNVEAMTDAEKDAYEQRLRTTGFNEEQIQQIEKLGTRATKAATEVTTFRAMVDAVTEGLGSGWAQSFQLIFGNLDEAKELWTALKDEIESIIGPVADARNEILQFWHDNGGRTAAIQAIADAWQGVKAIMDMVAGTFDVSFGSLSGKQLVDLTTRIGKLAKRFKAFATSASTLSKVERVFDRIFTFVTGLLDAFKALVSVVKKVFTSFKPFFSLFEDFGLSLFDALGDFGKFLTLLSKSEGSADGVKRAFSTLKDGLRTVVGSFETLVKSLLDFVKIDIKGNPLTGIFDTLTGFLSGFNPIESFSKVFEGVVDRIKSAWSTLTSGDIFNFDFSIDAIGGVFESIGKSVSEWVPKIIEYLGSDDFKDALLNGELLAGGGLLLSLTGLSDSVTEFINKKNDVKKNKGFFSSITGMLDNLIGPFVDLASSTVDKFTGYLDSISEHLSGLQQSVAPVKLVLVALALSLMASSITRLSGLDTDSAANAIVTLAVSLGILIGGLSLISSSMTVSSISRTLPYLLIGVAVALALVSRTVNQLSKLSPKALKRGLTGVGALVLELVAFAKGIDGVKVNPSSIVALLAVVLALKMLEGVVVTLSGMSAGELRHGLISIGALLLELAAFITLIEDIKVSFRSIIAILAVASAIKLLEGVVTTFGSMNAGSLKRSLIAIGALVLELAAFITLVDGLKVSLSSIVALIAITAAIKVLESVVTTFGSMDAGSLKRSLITIGALVLELAAFITLIEGTTVSPSSMIALIAITGALKVLEGVVTSFAKLSSDALKRSLVTMGALVLELVGFMTLMEDINVPITAILALAAVTGALFVIGEVLKSVAAVNIDSLANGFMIVALALGSLVAAAWVLGTGSPMMIVGAAAVLALALALSLFIPVVTALAESSLSFGDIAKAVGGIVIALLGLAVGLAALGVVSPLIAVFAVSLGILALAVYGLASALAILPTNFGAIAAFVTLLPGLIAGVIVGIAEGLVAGAQAFLNGIGPVLTAIGTALGAIGEFLFATVGPLLANVFIGILQAITVWAPIISAGLLSALVSIMNSLADGIREYGPAILSAASNLLSSIIELVLTAIADIVRLIPGVGDMLAGYIMDGKDAVREALAPESFESTTSSAMDSAATGIQNGGEKVSAAAGEVGTSAYTKFEEAFANSDGASTAFIEETIGQIESYTGDFTSAGEMNVEGYISSFANSGGAEEAGELASKAAEVMATAEPLFSEQGTAHGNAYTTALESVDASSAGASLSSSGASGAESMRGSYESAGSYVASGFDWGVASDYALQLAREAGAKLANAALNSIKITINSKSPSKETMKLGKYTSQGFAIGISSLTNEVYKESANVGNKAIDGIRGSLGEVSKYLDEDLDWGPTVRPVMDLSEIQNGISQANGMIDNGFNTPFIGADISSYPQSMMNAMLGSTSSSSNEIFLREIRALTTAIEGMEPSNIIDARGMMVNDRGSMSLIAEDVVNAFLRRGMM